VTVRAEFGPVSRPISVTEVDPLAAGTVPVAGDRNALFVDPRWLQCLSDAFGLRFSSLVVRRDRDQSSWLPFVAIDDLRGRRTTSLPFCDFVDTRLDAGHWQALSGELIARGDPILMKTLADHPATTDSRFVSEVDALHHVIATPDDLDEAFAGYASMTRRQIRRAENRGVAFRVSTERADLARFHRLHVHVRKSRHRLLAQPYALFDAIGDRFFDHDAGWMVLGEIDGRVEGGCLVLRSGDRLHYKFSVSSPLARTSGLSHAAIHETMRLCRDLGVGGLDLGRSDFSDEGLIEFKRRFRPHEVELACHRHDPGPRRPPTLAARLLPRLTDAATHERVPDAVTTFAGRHLYRYFA
jgi:hypothetical protein